MDASLFRRVTTCNDHYSVVVMSPNAVIVEESGRSKKGIVLSSISGVLGLPVLVVGAEDVCSHILPVGEKFYETYIIVDGKYDDEKLMLTAGIRRRHCNKCCIVSLAIYRMIRSGASIIRALASIASLSPESVTIVAWVRNRVVNGVAAIGSSRGEKLVHAGSWLALDDCGEGRIVRETVLVLEATRGAVRLKRILGLREARRA